MKRHLPNAVTCLNLLCGCLALTNIFAGAAGNRGLVCGRSRRCRLCRRPAGAGPAGVVGHWQRPGFAGRYGVVWGGAGRYFLSAAAARHRQPAGLPDVAVPYVGFPVTIFSALRLAKFNNDTRQTTSFIGLPTPACTLVVASLPLILAHDQFGLAPLFLTLGAAGPHGAALGPAGGRAAAVCPEV